MLDLRPYTGDPDVGMNKTQQIVYDLAYDQSVKRLIWVGSVRGGKTVGMVHAHIVMGILDRIHGWGNGTYILGGASVESIRRNQDEYWHDVAAQYGIPCRFVGGRSSYYELHGIGRYHLFGGKNITGVARVRGLTATRAWLDEASDLHPLFIDQCRLRLSFPTSTFALSTNTSNPWNPVYVDYVEDPTPGTRVLNSDHTENTKLDDETRAELYSGDPRSSSYRRNVLNEWVPDEGQVFPVGPDNIVGKVARRDGVVGMDAAASGITFAVLFTPDAAGNYIATDEYVHDGVKQGLIDEEEHLRRILNKGWTVRALVPDPSAAMLIAKARRMGFKVIPGKNDVDYGIRAVNSALASGRLLISDQCTQLLRAIAGYAWNSTLDAPAKDGHDHGPDSMRYAVTYLIPPYPASAIYAGPKAR